MKLLKEAKPSIKTSREPDINLEEPAVKKSKIELGSINTIHNTAHLSLAPDELSSGSPLETVFNFFEAMKTETEEDRFIFSVVNETEPYYSSYASLDKRITIQHSNTFVSIELNNRNANGSLGLSIERAGPENDANLCLYYLSLAIVATEIQSLLIGRDNDPWAFAGFEENLIYAWYSEKDVCLYFQPEDAYKTGGKHERVGVYIKVNDLPLIGSSIAVGERLVNKYEEGGTKINPDFIESLKLIHGFYKAFKNGLGA